MFVLNDDMSIYATRGDTVFFTVGATDGSGAKYKFKPDDVVRFKAFEKKACENVVAQKDFVITEETEEVNILLTEDDTRFGKIISKPRDYWYEIELNPFTNPQTIIGYDDDGPKVFRLYPESKNIVKDLNEEEFYADAELSMTSTNPVQNQAVTRAVANLSKYIDDGLEGVKDSVLSEEEALRIRGELRRLDAEVTQQKSDLTKYLPLEGGTLSGTVKVNDGLGHLRANNNAVFLEGYANSGDTTSRQFLIKSKSLASNITDALNLRDINANGVSMDYNIYGSHNKPSGSYAGNSSATKRTIHVGGIGRVVALDGNGCFTLVGVNGGFSVRYDGVVENLPSGVIYYDYNAGDLVITSDNGRVNKSGISFKWSLL